MYVNTEIADKYQEFFNFMSQEHDLTLTISEMDEIVSEAQKLVKKLAIPLVSQQRQLLLAYTEYLLKSEEMGDLELSDVDDFLKTNNR
jgi:hypothetical protein